MDTCTVLVLLRRKRSEEERNSHGLVDPQSFIPKNTQLHLSRLQRRINSWLHDETAKVGLVL